MIIKKITNILSAYYHSDNLIGELSDLRRRNTAFLIATGPSLKKQNLSLLANCDCFTVSNAYLHKDISIINPLIHVFAGYHLPLIKKNFIEWLADACKRLPLNTHILTTKYNQIIFGLENNYLDHAWHFVDTFKTAKYSWPYVGRAVLIPPQAGPLLILPILLQLGYKNIVLLGCDQNQLRNFRGRVSNFYGDKEDVRVNATDAGGWPSFESELIANLKMIKQYSFYAGWAKKLGVTIYNASDESWLDMFNFCSFEDALHL